MAALLETNISVCEGCLATGRKLTKLGKYTDLFCKLHYTVLDQVFREPVMCWECRGVFRKISIFRDQVTKAQCALKAKYENEPLEYKCLSTLRETLKINFDFEIVHTKKEIGARKYDAFVKLENIDMVLDEQVKVDDEEMQHENDIDIDENNSVFDNNEISTGETAIFKQNDEVDDTNNESEIGKFDDDDDFDEGEHSVSVNKTSKNTDTVIVKKKKKRKQIHYRYKVINMGPLIDEKNNKDENRLYRTEQIDKEEALHLYKEGKKENRVRYKSRLTCDLCFSLFPSEEKLKLHHKKSHFVRDNDQTCDICKRTFKTKQQTKRHSYKHLKKFECLLCKYITTDRDVMYKHLNTMHRKLWECVECQMRFPCSERSKFFKHYRDLHTFCICDECGMKVKTKSQMKYHLRQHLELICKECNISFKSYRSYKSHTQYQHAVQVSEETYCVECDIQFQNYTKYRYHINSSVKHRPPVKKSYKCPECDKSYSKNCAMKNHYNHFHLKKSRFICEICSGDFLNGYQLRRHIATCHNNIRPPKNKMCPYCDRGFNTNRILINHIRTHTGEKPFSCDLCSASFAQKSALMSHYKSIHKKTSEEVPFISDRNTQKLQNDEYGPLEQEYGTAKKTY